MFYDIDLVGHSEWGSVEWRPRHGGMDSPSGMPVDDSPSRRFMPPMPCPGNTEALSCARLGENIV
eukprot:scaffold147148_cov18-Prasinocladus_malaysianus.AAC.1